MNWRSGFSCSVVGCAAITCVGCGPALHWGGARGTAFIEWGGESSFLWESMHFYWMDTQHTPHLGSWTLGAWAPGCSRALLPPSDRQEDGLAAGGGRESRRGLLRWPWRFLPEPHTFLRTSGSCRGAVAVAPAWAGLGKISPLGRAMRWRRSGSGSLLLGGASRHHVTHRFRAAFESQQIARLWSHGITKRPEGDIGVFRSTFRSASFRSAKFSQRCLWRTP